MQLGETLYQTPEAFKAWSQNLGHEGVLTTFYSYGEVAPNRQREVIRALGKPRNTDSSGVDELADAIARRLKASS